MSEGKRPGGLTALAVLNFVFGGLGVLGVIGMAVLMAFMGDKATSNESEQALKQLADAWQKAGMGLYFLMLSLEVGISVLMVASGVGYLKQKKTLGRTLGTVYAVFGIASTLAGTALTPTEAGGGFNLGTILSLVYPVLTLALLNTTFKHDFVR